uniref:RING-type E3 ubiquitin transferase n=2 Tax=Trichobilharzia regenti TaxID=157069 RepID=A0AA85KJ87_TRIRE|nr:unnamed protein product [Trichobilharzia regenti]
MSKEHGGVTCNGCSRRDFRFRRYKCLVCRDYDLCGTCFDNQQETDKHSSYHPMQCLITKADHDIFYCGEGSAKHCVQSFTCSVCGQLGFTESSLSNHVFSNHPNAGDSEVLCPFCAIHTEGDPNLTTHDIASHFKSVHNLSPSVNEKNVTNSSSAAGSLIPRLTSVDNKCCDTASLRTRQTSQPRAKDFGFDKVGNFNCANTSSSTATFHNRLITDESCHNQNSANSSGITSQPVLYNPRFSLGSIVTMKNFMKSLEHDNKNKYHKNRLSDERNGCDNKPSNSKRNDEVHNSTVLHLGPVANGTDSQNAADKSPSGDTLEFRSNNNQDSANGNQNSKQIDCTTTTSVSQESKFIENPVLLSPCENENLTNQQNISRADSNGYLESLTSEVLDRKLNSLYPSPPKYSKSLSCDPHIKSVNDDKLKDVNKKLVFNCHTNEQQSELPPATVQDDWDIDWHMFLNELIWSSLCGPDAFSNIS